MCLSPVQEIINFLLTEIDTECKNSRGRLKAKGTEDVWSPLFWCKFTFTKKAQDVQHTAPQAAQRLHLATSVPLSGVMGSDDKAGTLTLTSGRPVHLRLTARLGSACRSRHSPSGSGPASLPRLAAMSAFLDLEPHPSLLGLPGVQAV